MFEPSADPDAIEYGTTGAMLPTPVSTAPPTAGSNGVTRAFGTAGGASEVAGEVAGVGASYLFPRELDVLRLVVNGSTNAQISHDLNISRNTTKTYIRTTYRKIGATSRAQAIVWGARRGLLGDQ